MKTNVEIDVWSDYVCPFCYLAEPAIAQVQEEFGREVTVTWRAFQLRPDPVPTLDPNGEYLRTVWEQSVYPMAARRGMTLKLPPVQPRSRLAHEAAAFAREHGRFEPMHLAIFRAFFEHGENIGKVDVLVRLGMQSGLDESALADALNHHSLAPTVREDELTARHLAISGVPAMLVRPVGSPLDEATLIQGAQPYEVLRDAVTGARVTEAGRT